MCAVIWQIFVAFLMLANGAFFILNAVIGDFEKAVLAGIAFIMIQNATNWRA